MNDDPKPGQIIEPGSGSTSAGGINPQPTGFTPAPNPFQTHAAASAAPSDVPTAPSAPPPIAPVQPAPPAPSLEPAVSPAETPPTPGSGHPTTPEPTAQPQPVPPIQPAPAPQPPAAPQVAAVPAQPSPPVQPPAAPVYQAPVAPAVEPSDNPLLSQDPTPVPPPIAQMPTDKVNTEPVAPASTPAPAVAASQPSSDDKKKKKPGLLARLGIGGKKAEPEKPQPAGPPVPEGTHISWQAPEFVQTNKPIGWYLLVAGFFAVLIALAILTHQWLSIGLFALMGATLAVYANRKPRVLNYEVTTAHLMVGQKQYGYGDFSAYYQGHDYNQTVFDLVPNKRFGTLVSLPAPHDMIDQIDEILAASLPKTEPHDDAIDKIFRALRF